MTEFNILAFGADRQNRGDCCHPLQKAMDKIRACGGRTTLVFPKGEYHFYKECAPLRRVHTSNTNSCEYPDKYCGFLIENQENLTIDGQGSMFYFHGNMQAVTVLKSKNIVLKNFSWDFPVPTVVELAVKERRLFSTVFDIPENFQWELQGQDIVWYEDSPLDGRRYWEWKNQQKMHCVVGVDPDTDNCCRAPVTKGPFFAKRSITPLSEHRIKVRYWKPASNYHRPGQVIQLCQNYVRECAGAFLWECKNVHVQHLTIHYMNGFGFLTQMCRDISFDHCHFVPNPQTKKQCTSFADLIHVSGAAGKVTITDCTFCKAHDDPINIHGTFTRVVKRMDSKTLLLEYVHRQQGGFPQFHPGDRAAFYSRDTLESINGDEEHLYTVETCTNPGEDGNSDKTMTIRLTEELPRNITDTLGLEKKYVAENVTYTPDVTIRGCRMYSIPTRGILCTTRGKTVIENNIFEGMSMATIYLSNDSGEWYESGPIRDMTIRDNTFYVLKSPQKEWPDRGGIYIHPVTKGGKLPLWETPIHKNITIENNVFYMEHAIAVKAESVENLTIRGNKIYRFERTGKEASVRAYAFTACKNVVMEANRYEKSVLAAPLVRDMPEDQIHIIRPSVKL